MGNLHMRDVDSEVLIHQLHLIFAAPGAMTSLSLADSHDLGSHGGTGSLDQRKPLRVRSQ